MGGNPSDSQCGGGRIPSESGFALLLLLLLSRSRHPDLLPIFNLICLFLQPLREGPIIEQDFTQPSPAKR